MFGAASLVLVACPPVTSAQCTNGVAGVLTGQYDEARDSVNSNETCLTPTSSTFYSADGTTPIFVPRAAFPTLLPASSVESPISAQPLYLPNVSIGGGTHNVVYVASLNDVVYAYDADNYGTGSPPTGVLYWSASLVNDCAETVGGVNYPGKLVNLPGVIPIVGILSTPVIDAANGIIYVVNACDVTGPNNSGMQWYLNALNLETGNPVVPPVIIAGAVTNSSGTTTFTPDTQLQRSALLVLKNAAGVGEVYIAFGAGTVEGSTQAAYHGWLFGYTINSTGTGLAAQSVFTTTPTAGTYGAMCNSVILNNYPLGADSCGEGGGIWMSGRGPAVSTTNGTTSIFLAVSNGGFQTQQPLNWGESVLKFPAGAATAPSDSFTPSQWYVDENENDEDLGTSGVLLFNGVVNGTSQPFLVVLDKAGNLFLLSQSSLGGFNNPDHAVQEFLATSSTPCPQVNVNDPDGYCDEPHSLVYWNSQLYMWPMKTGLLAYQFSNGIFATMKVSSRYTGYPGGMLALSSNGTSNGILWALSSPSTQAQRMPGTLSAFDAQTLSLLWTSSADMGFSSFAEPTVINGRVYVPTFNRGLVVFANH